jgi:hypothetical protein
MGIAGGRDTECKGQQNGERKTTFSALKEFQMTEPNTRKFNI